MTTSTRSAAGVMMSTPPDGPATTEPVGPTADDITRLGDSMSRLLRTFSRAKSQFLANATHEVEWSAHVLMRQLVAEGPMRLGALAGCVQSDPSTVSRQVAAMVKDGLIERRADPHDGRASILVATDKARAVYADHQRARDAHYQRMLADWSERDCRRLATLVSRFTEDFDHYRPNFFARPDESDRSATRGET